MLRNKKLLKLISIMLAISIVASGFCYYSSTTPVEADGPDQAIQGSIYAPGDEIVSKRTETAKTHYLGGNSYALDASMGAIHYKDNYQDNSEPWKDIDLTFDKNNKITRAPYELTVDTGNYSLTIKDKKTGQISSLRLMKIGSKEVKDIHKPVIISQGKMQWMDIDNDLDLAITADNDRVSFDWIVKSEDAPHRVEFEIQDGGIPVAFKGKDAENKPVEVKAQKTGNKLVESIEKGGKYPKTINPDYQIATSSRDCGVVWTGSAWEFETLVGNPPVGYIVSDLCKGGVGLSWITDIPNMAYITSANIKFTSFYSYSGGTVRSRITGQKLPTPYNFTTLASYQTQRGTVVGGADNTKITSSQVNWDNIGGWTANSQYTSPDISSIIQEIVYDPGWDSSVKAVVLFWDDHDGRSSTTDEAGRDSYSRNASSTKAPKLHVEYNVAPTVTTQAASVVEATTATGNGNITSTGGANCSRRGFCYKVGTSGDPTLSDSVAYDDGSFGTGAYNKSITGLSSGTSYRVKAYVFNTAGPGYGTTVQILTKPAAPTDVSATDGTYTGWVRISWTAPFGATGYKVYRSTNSTPPDPANPFLTLTNTSFDDASASIGTTYYYWVKAYNSSGDSTLSSLDYGWITTVGAVYNINYSHWTTIPGAYQITYNFLSDLGWPIAWSAADVDRNSIGVFTGNNAPCVNSVDLFWYAGHGAPGQIILVDDNPSWIQHRVGWDQVHWGGHVKWIMLYACDTLQNDPVSSTNLLKSSGEFAQALNGAHMICGFSNTVSPQTADGQNIADRLTGSNAKPLMTVKNAWFFGVGDTTRIYMPTCRVIAEDASYENEYIWGYGSGPAADVASDNYYVGWEYTPPNQ